MQCEALARLPSSKEELAQCLASPEWRLFSGCLYKIMTKGSDGAEPCSIPFRPNRAQRRFIERFWHRNIILKARQLGFTTLVAILWLDHALFNADQRCGIIAQDREAAEAIFRDKVKFAYQNLPPEIRERFPLARDSASELLFAHNNSSVRVATSMRSGTIHRLHVSEFGKICAKFPDKAKEVMTGSIPAVPLNGVLIIESTAEGANGDFYDLSKRAEALHGSAQRLTERDYRFHFYAWWQEPGYRMNVSKVSISREDHEYFEAIEQETGSKIDPEQRAWYVATRDADFAGAPERMWQEYPSTPAEAFQQSTDGHYLAKVLQVVTAAGQITSVPVLDAPVYTFWDIGRHDGTAIWFLQSIKGEDRAVGYYEGHLDHDLRDYARHIQERGFVYGGHFLPHDASHKKLSDHNRSTQEMLMDLLPGQRFHIVPPITQLSTGVQILRKHMKGLWLDKDRCAHGIERLRGYKKKWSQSLGSYTDAPDKHNGCSEAADALRQWAQAKEIGLFSPLGSGVSDYIEQGAADWRV